MITTTTLRLATGISALAVLSTIAPSSAAIGFAGPHAALAHRAHAPSPTYDAKNKKLLYVGDNANNQISIFNITTNVQSPNPIGVITAGLSGPQGITTDKRGNLYVTNLYGNTVTIYLPGKTSPAAVLSQGISSPTDVKVDGSGNIFVANSPGFGAPSSIVEFPAGSSSPSQTWVTPLTNEVISGLTLLDPNVPSQTSIYAAAYTLDTNGFATGYVLSCYPGNGTCVGGATGLGQTGGIAVTQSPGGTKPFTYSVVDQYVPGFDVFTNQQLSRTLATGGTPEFLAYSATRSDVFVADRFYGRVTEYSWPAGKVVNQFNPAHGNETTQIYGVAVTPAGTYF